MDMVLERAAKMAAAAPADSSNEEQVRIGMRLAAEYLKGKEIHLGKEIDSHSAQNQSEVRKGMAQTLLRNVVLPRDEQLQEAGQKALAGIASLVGKNKEIAAVCDELKQILEQYNHHKEQATQQLEDAIKSQLQQQQVANGQGGQSNFNPAMHPQYREELSRMLTGLNGQYTDAMDQRKDIILQVISQTR